MRNREAETGKKMIFVYIMIEIPYNRERYTKSLRLSYHSRTKQP